MVDNCIFNCEVCGGKVTAPADQSPDCCDKPMKKVEPLPVCETSETAEHSRLDNLGEPCDDGRAGK